VSIFIAVFLCSIVCIGPPIEFEYELVIWDYRAGELPETMGTLSWSGGGVASIRAVTISQRD
jgi:hypothetical protein